MAGVSSPTKEVATTSEVLHSQSFSDKVLKGLNSLREKELWCDYELEAGGHKFPVHKAVMAACSDYFQVMFTGEMVESRKSHVELYCLTPIGLKSVVEFAYTGSMELNLENIEEVLSAASHVQMEEAVELCCTFMEMALTVETCVDILNMCELYSLKNHAKTFILENFESLADTEQYMKLNPGQLASIIEDNSLKISSEYRLFKLVLRWINHDKAGREQYTSLLMENIRLPLLSRKELKKISKVGVMQDIKACADLLMEAKDYHLDVSEQPKLQTSKTQVRSDRQSIVICNAANLESYDIESKRHTVLKDAPMRMINQCVCVVDNFLYCYGGSGDYNDNKLTVTARGFQYDPRFNSWYETASMNEPRKEFTMVSYHKKLYAIAGQNGNAAMCSTECFSIANNDWDTCLALNHAVYRHAAAVCNDKIYISGGRKFDDYGDNYSTVFSYEPLKDQWTEESQLFNARSDHNMAEVNGCLFVVGGCEDDEALPVTSIERFDPLTGDWTVCNATLDIQDAGCCVYNNNIYIVCGYDGKLHSSDIIQKFDPKRGCVDFVCKICVRKYGKCGILTLPQCM